MPVAHIAGGHSIVLNAQPSYLGNDPRRTQLSPVAIAFSAFFVAPVSMEGSSRMKNLAI
jgi:hypothetical protein